MFNCKGFEPLLLIPIAFGGLLAEVIPLAHMTGPRWNAWSDIQYGYRK